LDLKWLIVCREVGESTVIVDIVFILTGGLEAAGRLKCTKVGDLREREVMLSTTCRSEVNVPNWGLGDCLNPMGVAAWLPSTDVRLLRPVSVLTSSSALLLLPSFAACSRSAGLVGAGCSFLRECLSVGETTW